jgi:hypothetical protein
MFDLEQLSEIDASFARATSRRRLVSGVEAALRARHGADDVTVVTQDAMLDVLDKVLRAVALGVVAIAAISILVGATGVLTVVWIAVASARPRSACCARWARPPATSSGSSCSSRPLLAGLGGAAGLARGPPAWHACSAFFPPAPGGRRPLARDRGGAARQRAHGARGGGCCQRGVRRRLIRCSRCARNEHRFADCAEGRVVAFAARFSRRGRPGFPGARVGALGG